MRLHLKILNCQDMKRSVELQKTTDPVKMDSRRAYSSEQELAQMYERIGRNR